MGLSYAVEKYMGAVHTLATSDLPLTRRLAGVANGLITLNSKDFPSDELWKRHSEIWEDLTWNDDVRQDEGKIDATMRVMLDHDAHQLAQRVFDFFLVLHEIDPLNPRNDNR